MKKYQQLVLGIITIVSFSCLLIYRHEYNKLRYVLEVLNFFGTPGMPIKSYSICKENQLNNIAQGAVPAWQRIDDSLFVYSAFLEKVNNNQHVKGFVVGNFNSSLHYGCYLWFYSNPKTKLANFSFSVLTPKKLLSRYPKNLSDKKTNAYVFYCKLDSDNRQPFGVSLFYRTKTKSYQTFISVVLSKSTIPVQNSTVICIMPSQVSQFSKSNYLEFLNFHKLIGINQFVIYNGIYDDLLSYIQNDRANNIIIKVLPWNYPFPDEELMEILAEYDCIERLKGVVENIIILEWNKYLVPHQTNNIYSALNQLDVLKKSNKFLFSTLLFCLEFKDNENSGAITPLIFKKTRYSLPKIDYTVPLYRPHLQSSYILQVPKKILAIHQYSNCNKMKSKIKNRENGLVDNKTLDFQNQFLKSQILVL